MRSCTSARAARAYSLGVAASRRKGSSSSTSEGCGRVQAASGTRNSQNSSVTPDRATHPTGSRSSSTCGEVSTVDVETTTSSSWGSCTSNAVTTDPQ